MKTVHDKISARSQGFVRMSCLLLSGLSLSLSLPSWSQTPMPPVQGSTAVAAPDKEALAPLPDPFYNALDRLSQKFKIAIIAEGRPFPQNKDRLVPSPGAEPAPEKGGQAESDAQAPPQEEAIPMPGNLSPEEAVQALAERFDYNSMHQGNVYILTKRYTHPDDMPDVTPEECLRGFQRLRLLNREITFDATNHVISAQGEEAKIVIDRTRQGLEDSRRHKHPSIFGTMNDVLYCVTVYNLAHAFYFGAIGTRKAATEELLENMRLHDPILRWQIIEKSPVFGYDTRFNNQANLVFLPLSDCERIQTPPYGTPVPCPGYVMRSALALPDPDPTDPTQLSQATKQFLDDNGRSSRAVTIAEVIAGLNKREKSRLIYKVDPVYAAKHVIIAGFDALSPEIVMQAMAAVYGLGVERRRDNTVALTDPPIPPGPSEAALYHNFGQYIRQDIPAPIYRAMHTRFLADRTKIRNQEGSLLLEYKTQYEFQRLAADYRNTALQMFRYLAEPQIKAQPQHKLALSRLGERARLLFALAQTASAYADICRVTEIPLPPYITDKRDFMQNVTTAEKFYRAEDGSPRMSLSLTYLDPRSGAAYGPVPFFDAPIN